MCANQKSSRYSQKQHSKVFSLQHGCIYAFYKLPGRAHTAHTVISGTAYRRYSHNSTAKNFPSVEVIHKKDQSPLNNIEDFPYRIFFCTTSIKLHFGDPSANDPTSP